MKKPPPRLSMLGPPVPVLDRRVQFRDKKADPFYLSPEWRALVTNLIRLRGRRCEAPDCSTPRRGEGQRIYGDHVIEINDGGALLNPENIKLLCASCHGLKTAARARERLTR
jgi:5-methylcytosine-specific restriction enzyme A